MFWWRDAGIAPQVSIYTVHTTGRCSNKLEAILAKEKVVINGSSHCVIKSSVSILKSRGREEKTPFRWLSQSIP